jgi:uncharacterized protein YkwD
MNGRFFRKYIAVLLALCLMFTLSLPALAVEASHPVIASKAAPNDALKQTVQNNEVKNEAETEAVAAAETADPVADFKAEVLRLLNIERSKVGAAALTSLDVLSSMADVRAQESASHFSHTRPDGTRCFTVFSDFSMTYRYAGENLAFGYSTPEAVVNAWMNSESHRKNMLGTKYKNIGVGYYLKDNGKIYCSLILYTGVAGL